MSFLEHHAGSMQVVPVRVFTSFYFWPLLRQESGNEDRNTDRQELLRTPLPPDN